MLECKKSVTQSASPVALLLPPFLGVLCLFQSDIERSKAISCEQPRNRSHELQESFTKLSGGIFGRAFFPYICCPAIDTYNSTERISLDLYFALLKDITTPIWSPESLGKKDMSLVPGNRGKKRSLA